MAYSAYICRKRTSHGWIVRLSFELKKKEVQFSRNCLETLHGNAIPINPIILPQVRNNLLKIDWNQSLSYTIQDNHHHPQHQNRYDPSDHLIYPDTINNPDSLLHHLYKTCHNLHTHRRSLQLSSRCLNSHYPLL